MTETDLIPVFDGHNDTLLRLYQSKEADVEKLFIEGTPGGHIDLPRAYIYAGRWDDAVRELERANESNYGPFDQVALARYKMWRGERGELGALPSDLADSFVEYYGIASRIHRTGRFEPAA